MGTVSHLGTLSMPLKGGSVNMAPFEAFQMFSRLMSYDSGSLGASAFLSR